MAILQSGSQGTEVQSLQAQLIKLGYQLTADGAFGPNTKAAVIQFQTNHNLTADGVVGPNTLAAINSQILANSIIKGIDISHNNGAVNWVRLGNEVSFVYCKASQGSTFKDPMLSKNFTNLKNVGIIRGAYHF